VDAATTVTETGYDASVILWGIIFVVGGGVAY